MPKISIIMPVYNKQDYIQRSLDSVLNQDFSDFELIAVDDGSTDNSLKILEEYQEKDPRIRVIHTENHGVSHARNIGLDNCEGEYLAFIDADDKLKCGYLSRLLKILQQSGADIVIQGITRVYPDGSVKEISSGLKDGVYPLSALMTDFAQIQKSTGIFGYCFSKFFPVSLAKDIRFDEELNLAEDFDFCVKIYRRIKAVYFDSTSNYLYSQDLPGSSVDIRDEDIDYKGQFTINCRYRNFMIDSGYYYGNNKSIITGMINASAYHMLFYSDTRDIRNKCALLKEKAEVFENIRDGKLFQSIVLRAAVNGKYRTVKTLIKAYRSIRTVKRRMAS